ncbi:MAG: class I SAM-dependent methyltransferase, partial [Dyella sp.]
NDLTASVDFTGLAEAGRSAGFTMASYLSQAQFLIAAGLQHAFEGAYLAAPNESARYQLSQQVKKLTLPEQMGERFQVMLLSKGQDLQLLPALLASDQGERL